MEVVTAVSWGSAKATADVPGWEDLNGAKIALQAMLAALDQRLSADEGEFSAARKEVGAAVASLDSRLTADEVQFTKILEKVQAAMSTKASDDDVQATIGRVERAINAGPWQDHFRKVVGQHLREYEQAIAARQQQLREAVIAYTLQVDRQVSIETRIRSAAQDHVTSVTMALTEHVTNVVTPRIDEHTGRVRRELESAVNSTAEPLKLLAQRASHATEVHRALTTATQQAATIAATVNAFQPLHAEAVAAAREARNAAEIARAQSDAAREAAAGAARLSQENQSLRAELVAARASLTAQIAVAGRAAAEAQAARAACDVLMASQQASSATFGSRLRWLFRGHERALAHDAG